MSTVLFPPLAGHAAHRRRNRLTALLLAGLGGLAGLTLPVTAQAEDRALILTIADYRSQPLPAVKNDVQLARLIARHFGIAEQNIMTASDERLGLEGMREMLARFEASIRPGDNAFIYYSGHGSRTDAAIPGQCSESFVTQDMRYLPDNEVEAMLQRIAARANRLVMFADACFSGGTATTRSAATSDPAVLPKAFGSNCANPINATRSLFGRSARSVGNLLYIAASAENEVSWTARYGSAATLSWLSCLKNPATDRDRSGAMTGSELRDCAQAMLDQAKFNQHVTLRGNAEMPLGFATAEQGPVTVPPLRPGGGSPAGSSGNSVNSLNSLNSLNGQTGNRPAPVPNTGSGPLQNSISALRPAPVHPPVAAPVPVAPTPAPALSPLVASLNNIANSADPRLAVQLRPEQGRIRVGQDFLRFSVTTPLAGYLTVLYVGSDGKSLDVLYPNQIDGANGQNRVAAGTHGFPRPNWQIRASGPAGRDHLLAIVSEQPLDMNRFATGRAGPFSVLQGGNAGATRNLVYSASSGCVRNFNIETGHSGCAGSSAGNAGNTGGNRIAASPVVMIEEY